MKILFVSPGVLYSEKYPFKNAGSESVIYGLSKELSNNGHEIFITGRFKESFKSKNIDGVTFLNVNVTNIRDKFIYEMGSSLLYSKAVVSLIKQIDPDIVSLNDRFSAYFPSKMNIKKTFTIHSPDGMEFFREFSVENNRFNKILFPIKKKIEEEVMARSDMIITLNKYTKSYLENMNFNNSCIIPNAVDVQKYHNKSDDNYLLYAGRIERIKGIKYLIHAFNELESDEMNLKIIGSGSDKPNLQKIVNSFNLQNKVEFIPAVSKKELSHYFSHCSAYILPSLFECMGITLLEAMASSKAVIASNIPGPKDFITNNTDGLLFQKGNVDELKDHLCLIIENKSFRKKLGQNGRKKVEKYYTFKKISKDYLDLFNKILNND